MSSPASKILDSEQPLREFELFLRARGFSKRQARIICSRGLRALLPDKTMFDMNELVQSMPKR